MGPAKTTAVETRTTTVESLLGVLSLGPRSGYEMRQFMEQSTGNFWNESFGQIYPALKLMLAEGLVEVEEDDAEGHPAKKVYRMTERGRERLREWLGMPLKPLKMRNELLLKLFFGDKAERGVLAEQVRTWRQRYAADLERYVGIEQKLETMHGHEAGMPYWRMTVRYGMAEARMIVAWCDETLGEMERVEAGRREKGVGSRE
jgi:DNA-binding PadR family transcriptional regulator